MTKADQPERPDEDLEPTLAESLPGTHAQSRASEDTLQPSHPAEWPFDGDERIPEQIGPYKIIGIIGSGGMGAVYEAAQENPKRRVALKVVKSGRASPSAMKRFQFEVETLARLRHPGIAQIYEAGTWTGAGHDQPFFAMEYIPGARPLTQYADDMELDVEDRLRLFIRVCDAVHHGHQKGIIHRDLKPDNILVDRDGNPKIIDFGVARATDADMAITTLQTSVGQLIGTLQYMSPEQCLGDPALVDTRADVYSLGVILYELLCHELPYDVQRQAMLEAIRIIREDAPKRPSTITRIIRGDLETISLKALEKQSDRRYESAISLGHDLERYLRRDPIEARPPSIAYQIRMFAAKHRMTALSAALVVLAISGGLIATAIAWSHAADLNIQLEAANVEVTAQRDLAQSRLQIAKDLHRSQLRDTLHAVRRLKGATDEKLRIAGSVTDYFSGLQEAGQADRTDLESLADAWFELADIRGGSVHGNTGQFEEALGDIRRAREVWQTIAADAPEDITPQAKIGLMHRREGLIQQQLNRATEAISSFERAYETLRDVPADDPNAVGAIRIRGLALLDQGDVRWGLGDLSLARHCWERGLNELEQLSTLDPENSRFKRDQAHAMRRIGLAQSESDVQAALEILQDSRMMLERLHADLPDHDAIHRDLAAAWYYEGWAAMLIPKREQSLDALDQCWTITLLRCANNPGDHLSRQAVTSYLDSMIEICQAMEASDWVIAAAERGAVHLQPVSESHPENRALAEVLARLVEISQKSTTTVSAPPS